jgi:hypothetical protein
MSDGPAPTTWETAAPSLLWGVFAFAFGFEGVAMIFEGKWILAGCGIIAAIVLTGAAMRWKQLAALSPNLSKTGTTIATDARLWVALLGVFFVALIFHGLAVDGLIPFVMNRVSASSSDTGRIVWNFEQTARGAGYFLTMQKTGDQEIRVIGFGAWGKNTSSDPVSAFSGYMRSDKTNAEIPVYILAQDANESTTLACFAHPWIPTLPGETFGIPPFADFQIVTHEKPVIETGKDGIPITKFFTDFVPFTILLEYDGRKVERHFSREEVTKQIEIFEKSMNPLSNPYVLRRATAPTPSMPMLSPLMTPAPPPETWPSFKPLLSDPDYAPTGAIAPPKN